MCDKAFFPISWMWTYRQDMTIQTSSSGVLLATALNVALLLFSVWIVVFHVLAVIRSLLKRSRAMSTGDRSSVCLLV
jgi:hypothetical protein